MQQIFGLSYDYEHRNGTNLVLFRDDGVREEELSRIQTKMLHIGQVPRLLPFVAEHLDGRVRLVYDIGSRRMLQQALRAEQLTVQKALQLLLTVTASLEECRSYMLQENGFVLRETFLFVGADVTDISFVYVPLASMEAPSIAEELERFIHMISAYVPSEDCSVLLPFTDYCRSGAFRVKELKRKLIEQLTAASVPAHKTADLTPVRRNEPIWSDPLFDLEKISLAEAMNAPDFLDFPDWSSIADKSDKTDDDSPASPFISPKRLSMIVAASGVIVCGWLWNRWLEQPSSSLLQISIGVTLLTLDAWILLRYAVSQIRWEIPMFWRSRNKAAQASPAAVKAQPAFSQTFSLHEPAFPLMQDPPAATIDPQEYYASLSKHTTMLRRPADATMLLKPALQAPRSPNVYAYLEVASEHPPKHISLRQEPYVIGRSAEHTDYRLDGEGISRQHVEIVYEESTYAAKDLGSTNGTLWNGEIMVPYRAYPLQEGDFLTLARTELRFRFVENIRKTV